MIKVYGMATSGNCWKAAQILRLTGHAFDWIEIDTTKGDTATPAFLALNPQGEVPVVTLEDGAALTQSNAILAHFAEATPWLPAAGLTRTRVLEWLFWEQYSHEPYIAVARNLITYRGQRETQAGRLALCATRCNKALDIMEQRLSGHAVRIEDPPHDAEGDDVEQRTDGTEAEHESADFSRVPLERLADQLQVEVVE